MGNAGHDPAFFVFEIENAQAFRVKPFSRDFQVYSDSNPQHETYRPSPDHAILPCDVSSFKPGKNWDLSRIWLS